MEKRKILTLVAKIYNKFQFYRKLWQCKVYLRQKAPMPHDLRFWYIERQNYRAMR
jgi:hypothetical protein